MGADRELTEPTVAFCVRDHEQPALEVRINFGVFTGRHATPAEIDDLARALHDLVPSLTIIAEERHEFGGLVEASIHQVVIEIAEEFAGDDVESLCDSVVAVADEWVEACVASRHTEM